MATYTGYGDGNSDSLFGIYLELEREGSAPNSNFFSDQDFMECVWHVRCIPHHKSIRQVWASVCVNHLKRCKTSNDVIFWFV